MTLPVLTQYSNILIEEGALKSHEKSLQIVGIVKE
jgi:hypothetical protein